MQKTGRLFLPLIDAEIVIKKQKKAKNLVIFRLLFQILPAGSD